ncbi:hypothetical protein KM043_009331 [Ampulex compressa]|nr:hypothetical protein KM043_009331 [Ampulex compressa]
MHLLKAAYEVEGGGGAHYIAWRTLVPVLACRRTGIPDSVNRLNCAGLISPGGKGPRGKTDAFRSPPSEGEEEVEVLGRLTNFQEDFTPMHFPRGPFRPLSSLLPTPLTCPRYFFAETSPPEPSMATTGLFDPLEAPGCAYHREIQRTLEGACGHSRIDAVNLEDRGAPSFFPPHGTERRESLVTRRERVSKERTRRAGVSPAWN